MLTQIPLLKIRKLDILAVYPTGANKTPKLYRGRKWALVAYELTGEVKGVLDVPIPPGTDNVLPVCVEALTREIRRGTFDEIAKPEKLTYRIDNHFAVAVGSEAAA